MKEVIEILQDLIEEIEESQQKPLEVLRNGDCYTITDIIQAKAENTAYHNDLVRINKVIAKINQIKP